MAEKSKKEKFSFKYVYPEDLRDLYVNGCLGGTTPRDEIYIHFYSERLPIPKEAIHAVGKDGRLSDNPSLITGGDVIRFIQTSVTMNLNTAKAIKSLLDDFITQTEKKRQSNKES